MPLLFYWRGENYRKEIKEASTDYNLNQTNPIMHEVGEGDSIWAFTRTRDGRYVLAAELVVSEKTFNPPNSVYGLYRVHGDKQRSRYFETEGQPDATQLIRSLSIRAKATILGHSFQGSSAVRRIDQADHEKLQKWAEGLAVINR